MSGQQQQHGGGLSVSDIASARNSKLASETALSSSETAAIATELEGAHREALALKDDRAQQGDPVAPVQVRGARGNRQQIQDAAAGPAAQRASWAVLMTARAQLLRREHACMQPTAAAAC